MFVNGQWFEFYENRVYCLVAKLQAGSSFGELALMAFKPERHATVVCETDA